MHGSEEPRISVRFRGSALKQSEKRQKFGLSSSTEEDHMVHDPRKHSFYFSEEMLTEIRTEAERLDRSLSWVVQKAWKLAAAQLKSFPGVNEPPTNQ